MHIVKSYNGLNGTVKTRTEVEQMIIAAEEQEQPHIAEKLQSLLNNYDDSSFEIEVTQKQPEAVENDILQGLAYAQPQEVEVDPGMGKPVSPDEIYQMITDKMIAWVQKVTGKNFKKKWKVQNEAGYLIPFNFDSKKEYRGVNALLLTEGKTQTLENPFFLTFNQIKKHDGKLKKGSKGSEVVYFTRLYKVSWKEGDKVNEFGTYKKKKMIHWIDDNRDKLKKSTSRNIASNANLAAQKLVEKTVIPILKYYNVFNGKDIEGIDFDLENFKIGYKPADKTVKNDDPRIDIAEKIVNHYPDPQPEIKDSMNGKAFYRHNATVTVDEVHMPKFEDFERNIDYYRTLFHELTHSTGAPNRLNRTMIGKFGSKKYAKEELVAEFGAVFLSAQAGIIWHSNANHAEYLKNWSLVIKKAKKDNRFLMRAASKAQAAADFILDRDKQGVPAYRKKVKKAVLNAPKSNTNAKNSGLKGTNDPENSKFRHTTDNKHRLKKGFMFIRGGDIKNLKTGKIYTDPEKKKAICFTDYDKSKTQEKFKIGFLRKKAKQFAREHFEKNGEFYENADKQLQAFFTKNEDRITSTNWDKMLDTWEKTYNKLYKDWKKSKHPKANKTRKSKRKKHAKKKDSGKYNYDQKIKTKAKFKKGQKAVYVKNNEVVEIKKVKIPKKGTSLESENRVYDISYSSGKKAMNIPESLLKNPKKQKGKTSKSVIDFPIDQINLDEERFQNRERLNVDVVNNIVENYTPTQFDPIVVWTDPKDNKVYLLAGHHRLEALQKMGKNEIPVKFADKDYPTEKDAIKYAKRLSNANRTLETPMERAKIYREMIQAGETKKDVEKAAEIEGKNKSYILNLAYLSDTGQTLNALNKVFGTSDKQSEREMEKYADWIGQAKRQNSNLTKSHEQEMYDFLMSGASDRITTKRDFLHKISSITGKMFWNPDQQPLNLKKFKYKTEGEKVYDQEIEELKEKIAEKEQEIEDLKNRFNDPAAEDYISPDDKYYEKKQKLADKKIDQWNANLKRLRKQLQELYQNKGKYTNAGTEQAALFGKSKKRKKPENVSSIKKTAKRSPKFDIAGQTGIFLDGIEQKPQGSVVITLDGAQGSGKTTSLFKFLNEFALAKNNCLFASLEEHPDSNLFIDKRNKFINPKAQEMIDIADHFEDYQEFCDTVEYYDCIFIDSWQKLVRMVGKIKLDEDLRQKFDGKVFVIIFQRTTTGRTKGGAEIIYDADVLVKLEKHNNFSENYAYFDKNRYTSIPTEKTAYNVAGGYVYDPTEKEAKNNNADNDTGGGIVAEIIN